MNTDQIAAEAADKLEKYLLSRHHKEIVQREIKSAIEKATEQKDKQLQSVVAFLETCKFDEWDRKELLKVLHLTVSRAAPGTSSVADASEQGAEKLAQELRNIVNCDLAGMRWDFGEDSDSQFRQWAQNRAKAALSEYESQRPTPATASEPKQVAVGYPLTEEQRKRELDAAERTGISPCLSGKPDSASTGKNEALQIIDEQIPHFQFALTRKNGRQVWLHDLIREIAATPSGGGREWHPLIPPSGGGEPGQEHLE